MLKKVNNPFVNSLKAQMQNRFPGLEIEVNPRSAWVKGEVPALVQQTLKNAGFLVCGKGWYFTHECVKMPAFQTVQTVKSEPKPVKKDWTELNEDVKDRIVKDFLAKFPGCQAEVRGTWIVLTGLVFKTNETYREAIKAEGFHYGYKVQEWSRALKPEEMTVPVKAEEKAPAAAASENVSHTVSDETQELIELSRIVIAARTGKITRDQMIARMKEVCPF